MEVEMRTLTVAERQRAFDTAQRMLSVATADGDRSLTELTCAITMLLLSVFTDFCEQSNAASMEELVAVFVSNLRMVTDTEIQ